MNATILGRKQPCHFSASVRLSQRIELLGRTEGRILSYCDLTPGENSNSLKQWTLHGQNDTKFRFSAHHAGVAFGRFHKWVLFNHWAYAGHLREAQRVFGVRRDSSRPALDSLPPENQLRCRNFDSVNRRAHNQEYAVRSQAADQ